MKKIYFLSLLFSIGCILTSAQDVNIQVDASSGRKAISPYIYGKNNSLSINEGNPLTESEWQLLRDAGVRLDRNSGNNSTKYNWSARMSSHPDWYNNVYSQSWDYAAQSAQENMPDLKLMCTFQLAGWVASSTAHNFDDSFNGWAWWPGVNQNLAGGGVMDETWDATDALADGDYTLYLKQWPPDSTVAILDNWFGAGGLDLNSDQFEYWSMDNEPGCWGSTHDDIYAGGQPSAEEYMQKYFAVAKKAKALFPGIKLCGPVPCNEWFWYAWDNDYTITFEGSNYTWLEYFIKRVADEELASGIRLLDVLDIHSYPGYNDYEDLLQQHRVFFDREYSFPHANGVKGINGGWDNNITQEYIFGRCNEWLDEHMGSGHGVSFALTENGFNEDIDPSTLAVWYASHLGTFAKENVEIFTPWFWGEGMWETIHLFSRYSKGTSVLSTSDLEEFVSAYSSLNNAGDSLTTILVNRSLDQTYNTSIDLMNFGVADGNYTTLSLLELPEDETFESHTVNALQQATAQVSSHTLTMSLPPLSITAVLLEGTTDPVLANMQIENNKNTFELRHGPSGIAKLNYAINKATHVQIDVIDMNGRRIQTLEDAWQEEDSYSLYYNTSHLQNGLYLVQFKAGIIVKSEKLVVMHN